MLLQKMVREEGELVSLPPPNFCGGPAEWTIFCNNEEVFVAVYLIIIVSPQWTPSLKLNSTNL